MKKDKFIKIPLNADGTLGLDQFNQMMAVTYDTDGEGYSASPVANLFGRTCYICGQPFEPTAEAFRSAVHLQGVKSVVHARCFRQHQNINEEGAVSGMICDCRRDNGFGGFRLTPFANSYPGSGDVDGYLVTFVDYHPEISIHWRKRVREIALLNCEVPETAWTASKMYEMAGTKSRERDRIMVHAEGDAEARLYLGEMVAWACRPEYTIPFVTLDDHGNFWHAATAEQAATRAFSIWEERGEGHMVSFHRSGKRVTSPCRPPREMQALCNFLKCEPVRE